MCDFCKDIGTNEKALLTYEMDLRGEVTMYRDAYRSTMRMLELANKELRNLRELRNMKEKTK